MAQAVYELNISIVQVMYLIYDILMGFDRIDDMKYDELNCHIIHTLLA